MNRRQYEQYMCRRIPGKQAVAVMACDNTHIRYNVTSVISMFFFRNHTQYQFFYGIMTSETGFMNITKNEDVFCFGDKSFETIYLEYVVLSIN